jgi:hypothetical protein
VVVISFLDIEGVKNSSTLALSHFCINGGNFSLVTDRHSRKAAVCKQFSHHKDKCAGIVRRENSERQWKGIKSTTIKELAFTFEIECLMKNNSLTSPY